MPTRYWNCNRLTREPNFACFLVILTIYTEECRYVDYSEIGHMMIFQHYLMHHKSRGHTLWLM